MLSPYENIIIGNFLYGLGLLMGREPDAVDGCVNLTQQTQLDGVLGDVMLQFSSVWRLIEFKRHGAAMKKENAKVEVFRGALSDTPALEAVSRKVHWYVESGLRCNPDTREGTVWRSVARPYLDLRQRGAGMTMAQFAQQTVREACDGDPTPVEELELYMALIKAFGCLDGANTAGLLVGVSSAGGLAYVPLDNIADLRETASQLSRLSLERELAHQQREADAAQRPFSPQVHEHQRSKTLEREAPTDDRSTGHQLGY